jgi:hypothetical protein
MLNKILVGNLSVVNVHFEDRRILSCDEDSSLRSVTSACGGPAALAESAASCAVCADGPRPPRSPAATGALC